MSKADKMFKDLGYELNLESLAILNYIKYYFDDDNVFYFDMINKSFYKSGAYDGMCDPITMKELKAINENIKELGWEE